MEKNNPVFLVRPTTEETGLRLLLLLLLMSVVLACMGFLFAFSLSFTKSLAGKEMRTNERTLDKLVVLDVALEL